MLKLHLTLLSIFCSIFSFNGVSSRAQSLDLFDVDPTGYPTVRANFYAFNKDNKQDISLLKDDCSISENGVNQQVLKVIHPIYQKAKPVSLLLTMDISGSMKGENLEMAKLAANTILENIDLHESECALTSFDDRNYINIDFSHSKSRLVEAVNSLKENGGTEFDNALLTPSTGALDIASNGQFDKVIIFLTDGFGEASEQKIINKAKEQGIRVYCVTLGIGMPKTLQKIALETGGECFSHIESKEDASRIYLRILHKAQKTKPSTIIWNSITKCHYSVDVNMIAKLEREKNSSGNYSIPVGKQAYFELNTKELNFSRGNSTASIALTATQADITVSSLKMSNSNFIVQSISLPFTIKNGSSKSLNIKYKSGTKPFETGVLTIENSLCESQKVDLSATTEPKLKIVQPNGGEVFLAGSTTNVTWSGVELDDFTQLEYSIDEGQNWNAIEKTKSKSVEWKVPDVSSQKTLVRASIGMENKTSNRLKEIMKLEKTQATTAFFGDLGSNLFYINSYNSTGGVTYDIYDFTTEKRVMSKEFQSTHQVRLTKNKEMVSSHLSGSNIVLSEVSESNKHIKNIPHDSKSFFLHHSKVDDSYYYQDGDQIIRKHLNSTMSEKLKINLHTDRSMSSKDFYHDDIGGISENYFLLDPYDGSYFEVWDFRTGEIALKKSFASGASIHGIGISSNEKYLAVVVRDNSAEKKITIHAFSLENKQELYTLPATNIILEVGGSHFTYYNDGNLNVANIETGATIATLPSHWSSLSSDGKYIISYEKHGRLWVHEIKASEDPNSFQGQDQSDSVFSIVKPEIIVKDIGFKEVLVGRNINKLFNEVTSNKSGFTVSITDVVISGNDKESFRLISETNQVLKNSETKDLELGFTPKRQGLHEATITFKTSHGDKVALLTGYGVNPTYKIQTRTINLGKIMVGKKVYKEIPEVIKNIGSSTCVINNVELSNNANKQLSLLSASSFSLKKNKSSGVGISFDAKHRGKITGEFVFEFEDGKKEAIQVLAEVIAPKQHQLVVQLKNKMTKAPIAGNITLLNDDDLGKRMVASDENGSYTFNIIPDFNYILVGNQDGFKNDTNSIDLRIARADKVLKVELLLDPPFDLNAPKTTVIKGQIFDNDTKKPLQGKITIRYNEQNIELITDENGNYKFEPIKPFAEFTLTGKSKNHLSQAQHLKVVSDDEPNIINFYLADLSSGQTVQLNNVLFVRSKPVLLKESYEQLDLLVAYLIENEDKNIVLSGHTDNTGSASLNLRLSEERVVTIKNYLIEKGVNKKRISGQGYGGTKPIASNSSEDSRRLNRRVEFKILD